jgi:hypothetical protein
MTSNHQGKQPAMKGGVLDFSTPMKKSRLRSRSRCLDQTHRRWDGTTLQGTIQSWTSLPTLGHRFATTCSSSTGSTARSAKHMTRSREQLVIDGDFPLALVLEGKQYSCHK